MWYRSTKSRWRYLSRNPNITWNIVQQYPDKPWDWYYLSGNPSITLDIVQQNPDKPWDWSSLSINPNITWNIVQQYPDKPWNWYMLSSNPNITLDIVQQNQDNPWDWYCLSSNPNIFKLSDENIITHIRHYIASNRIKRFWKTCNSDPNYSVCRKRLLREYNSLKSNF